MRRDALRWLKTEFDLNYQGKVAEPWGKSRTPRPPTRLSPQGCAPQQPHLKRRKTSAAGFFANSDSEESGEEEQEEPQEGEY